MEIRSEPRRRLEFAFQRRVDDRQRQFAVQWRDACRLGEQAGLGQALGIFRTDVYPPPGRFWLLRLTAPMAAIPVLIAAAAKGVRGLLPLLITTPFLIGGWFGLASLRYSARRYHRWLFAYAEGFAEFDEGSPPDRTVRWDEVTEVGDTWTEIYNDEGPNSWSFAGHGLTLRAEPAILIRPSYRNMLDPYFPVGRILSSLLPSTVASTIPRLPTIDELITSHVIQRLLDRDLAIIRAGRAVERAGMRVSKDGLLVAGQTASTPWSAIDRIDLTPGLARIQPRAGGRKTTHPIASPGPRTLCFLLKQLGIRTSFDPSG